jgi:hypothetical protein
MDRATAALTGLPVEALPADKPVTEAPPFTEAQIRQHRINDYANDAIKRDQIERAEGRFAS